MPDLEIHIWYDEDIEEWAVGVFTDDSFHTDRFSTHDPSYGNVVQQLINYLNEHLDTTDTRIEEFTS